MGTPWPLLNWAILLVLMIGVGTVLGSAFRVGTVSPAMSNEPVATQRWRGRYIGACFAMFAVMFLPAVMPSVLEPW